MYQGKGYGKKAKGMLIDRLQQEYNCKKIYVSVAEENTLAVRMYEGFGFRFTGRKDVYGGKS